MKDDNNQRTEAAAATTAATLAAAKVSEVVAVIGNDISWIKKSLTGIETSLESIKGSFVSKVEFDPIHENIIEYHKKVDDLQRTVYIWMGAIGIVTFLVPIVLKFFFK